MNATIEEAPVAAVGRSRVTPGATQQTPLRLLQTPRRPAARPGRALPRRDWLSRLSTWWQAGR